MITGSVGAGKVTVSKCVAVTIVLVSATTVSVVVSVGVYVTVTMLCREVGLAVALKLLTHRESLTPSVTVVIAGTTVLNVAGLQSVGIRMCRFSTVRTDRCASRNRKALARRGDSS
jgi:hypothetical protein